MRSKARSGIIYAIKILSGCRCIDGQDRIGNITSDGKHPESILFPVRRKAGIVNVDVMTDAGSGSAIPASGVKIIQI